MYFYRIYETRHSQPQPQPGRWGSRHWDRAHQTASNFTVPRVTPRIFILPAQAGKNGGFCCKPVVNEGTESPSRCLPRIVPTCLGWYVWSDNHTEAKLYTDSFYKAFLSASVWNSVLLTGRNFSNFAVWDEINYVCYEYIRQHNKDPCQRRFFRCR